MIKRMSIFIAAVVSLIVFNEPVAAAEPPVTKTVLFIRVAFAGDLDPEPMTEELARTRMEEAKAWFEEVSYGDETFQTEFAPLVGLPGSASYYQTAGRGVLAADAFQALQALPPGLDAANYDIRIVRHKDIYPISGLSDINSIVWLGRSDLHIWVHEL